MNQSSNDLQRNKYSSIGIQALQQRFTTAKKLSLQMFDTSDLIDKSSQHYLKSRKKIIKLVQSCLDYQKGQIYLILYRISYKIAQDFNENQLSLEESLAYILLYFDFLLNQNSNKQQGSACLIRRAYKGGTLYKNSTIKGKEISKESGRKYLLDLLIIERTDIILRILIEMIPLNELIFQGNTLKLINFLKGSIFLTSSFLDSQQRQIFKSNIDIIKSSLQILKLNAGHQKLNNSIKLKRQLSNQKSYLQRQPKHSSTSSLKRSVRNSSKPSYLTGIEKLQSFYLIKKSAQKRKSVLKKQKTSILSRRISQRNSIQYQNSQKRISRDLDTLNGRKVSFADIGGKYKNGRSSFFTSSKRLNKQKFNQNQISEQKRTIILFQQQVSYQKQLQQQIKANVLQLQRSLKLKEFFIYIFQRNIVRLAKVYENKQNQTIFIKFLHNDLLTVISKQEFANNLIKDQSDQYPIGFLKDYQFLCTRLNGLKYLNKNCVNHNFCFFLRPKTLVKVICYVRKISTHFINQFVFNQTQLQGAHLNKIILEMLSNLYTFHLKLSTKCILMDSKFSQAFETTQNMTIQRGTKFRIIYSDEKSQIVQHKCQKYEISIQNFYIRQIQEVKFSIFWREKFQLQRFKNRSLTKKLSKQMSSFSRRTSIHKTARFFYQNSREAAQILQQKDIRKTMKSCKTIHEINLPIEDLQKSVQNSKNCSPQQFIESIKTQKGFKLVKYQLINGLKQSKVSHYYGFLQRNPQKCMIQTQKKNKNNEGNTYLRKHLSIHGNSNNQSHEFSTKQSIAIPLISFSKKIKTQKTVSSWIISSIKMISQNQNNSVFIESYWQIKQRYYVFEISSQNFRKITEINTKWFPWQAFATTQLKINKKLDKKTSVFGHLFKGNKGQKLRKSAIGRIIEPKKNQQQVIKEAIAEDDFQMFDLNLQSSKAYFKTEAFTKTHARLKTQKSYQTSVSSRYKMNQLDSISKSLKNDKKLKKQFQKQILTRLKNKLIKSSCFVWKDNSLFLQIKVSYSIFRFNIFECQGHQLAMKTVYDRRQSNKKSRDLTQLIFIKYKQKSLCNLNHYNMQGISKIYIERHLIKNNLQLRGKSIKKYSINQIMLTESQNFPFSFKQNQSEDNSLKYQKSKRASLLRSGNCFEELKKFSYSDILSIAQKCSITNQKANQNKSNCKNKFYMMNKYMSIPSSQIMLLIEFQQEYVLVKTVNGDLIQTVNLAKLKYQYLEYIKDVDTPFLKRLLAERIFKDQFIMSTCAQ